MNSKGKKCEKQNECQRFLSICCEFKIVKRRLVENIDLILNGMYVNTSVADLGYIIMYALSIKSSVYC